MRILVYKFLVVLKKMAAQSEVGCANSRKIQMRIVSQKYPFEKVYHQNARPKVEKLV